jgi:hypothetical protein
MNKMRRINPINCLMKSQLFEIEFSTVRDDLNDHDGLLDALEVLPNHCQLIMVAERKGLTDWAYRTSTRERVPLPFYRKGGREGFAQDLYSGRI